MFEIIHSFIYEYYNFVQLYSSTPLQSPGKHYNFYPYIYLMAVVISYLEDEDFTYKTYDNFLFKTYCIMMFKSVVPNLRVKAHTGITRYI